MDEIDRMLNDEPILQPSVGFSTSVMNAVRKEASMPAPIEFPWARCATGFGAVGLLGLSVFIVLALTDTPVSASIDMGTWIRRLATPNGLGAGIAALATVGSLIVAGLTMRGDRGFDSARGL